MCAARVPSVMAAASASTGVELAVWISRAMPNDRGASHPQSGSKTTPPGTTSASLDDTLEPHTTPTPPSHHILLPPRRTAIRLLCPLSHPLLRPVRKVLVLFRPSPAPIPQIRQNALWPARPHPQAHDRQTAPEQDFRREAQPEHDGAEQHVEDLEREEDDYEEQGEGREVGFLREGVDERRCVGFEDAGVGEEGQDVGAERVGGGEQVGGPFCGFVVSWC
jgi:hypothetical protein